LLVSLAVATETAIQNPPALADAHASGEEDAEPAVDMDAEPDSEEENAPDTRNDDNVVEMDDTAAIATDAETEPESNTAGMTDTSSMTGSQTAATDVTASSHDRTEAENEAAEESNAEAEAEQEENNRQGDGTRLEADGDAAASAAAEVIDTPRMRAHSEADAKSAAVTEIAEEIKAAAVASRANGPVISCLDAKMRRTKNSRGERGATGMYYIEPPDRRGGFHVWCDQDTAGGGWMVFLKRVDDSLDFYRGWTDYVNGFGSPHANFWLGLDRLHRLTRLMPTTLRVELSGFGSRGTQSATYREFMVNNAKDNYRLTVRRFVNGGIGDSLSYHNGAQFSTFDRDNDEWTGSCAAHFHGAWWYRACHHSNLNGYYFHGHHASYANGIDWLTWHGHYESAKTARMMIR